MNCEATTIDLVKAERLNLRVNAGDNNPNIIFKFWSDVAKTEPIDISGNTYVFRIFSGSVTKVIIANEITSPNILTCVIGKITLSAITYQWDLKQTDADGNITTYRYGDFQVLNR